MIFSSSNLIWTQHSLVKLKQYRLSASRVLRVLRYPKRCEVGVAENTTASMQAAGSKRRPYEIWVMYQQKIKNIPTSSRILDKIGKKLKMKNSGKITIISAWRYPGISPIHKPPPIPDEVWEILSKH